MQRPPHWSEFPRFPVTAGTIMLATGVTIASYVFKVDVSQIECSVSVMRGELWRLLSCTLPHANFIHLLFDVLWIWIFGTIIEDAFGHLATFAIFLLLAAGSSAAQFAFLYSGIGLSGVGYGLFGLLLALSKRDRRFADAMDRNTAILFLVWFLLCVVLTMTNVWRIGNIAHASGLVLGLGLGWALAGAGRPDHRTQRILGLTGTVLLALFFIVLAVPLRPYVNFSPDAAADVAHAGYVALEDNRDQEAVRWLSDATRMQPRVAGYWQDLGVAYERLHQYEKADAAFAKAEHFHFSK